MKQEYVFMAGGGRDTWHAIAHVCFAKYVATCSRTKSELEETATTIIYPTSHDDDDVSTTITTTTASSMKVIRIK